MTAAYDPELCARLATEAITAVTSTSLKELDRWVDTNLTSAVIAVATVDYVVSGTSYTEELEQELGDQYRWFFGPIGYVLRDVRVLPDPVPCKGALGFWTLPPDVEAKVVEQLARIP